MAEPSRHSSFSGWYWRWIFRLATRQYYRGIPVGLLWQEASEQAEILSKIDAALGLIARYDPRRLDRLVHDARGILVIGTVGGIGTWTRDARLVRLREDYVLDTSTSSAHLASTLVHEGTHAWLCRLGFGYEDHRRARIEAICYRSEIAFARRLPEGEMLVPDLEKALTLDPAYYSTKMQREQTFKDLRTLGAPQWLVRLLSFASGKRAA